jgi:hypothetical protein
MAASAASAVAVDHDSLGRSHGPWNLITAQFTSRFESRTVPCARGVHRKQEMATQKSILIISTGISLQIDMPADPNIRPSYYLVMEMPVFAADERRGEFWLPFDGFEVCSA